MPSAGVHAVLAAHARLKKAGDSHSHEHLDPSISVPNQLNRFHFVERLRLEKVMWRKGFGLVHFICLIIAFVMTLSTYDPIADVGAVHEILRERFDIESAKSCDTPAEVINYMQGFIETTYLMASALVDANTMNSIDPIRCFDLDTDDICRLEYWEVQTRRTSDPKFVDLQSVFNDDVSPLNQQPSNMDCRAEDPAPNCMEWSSHVNPNLTSVIMGLTPEDPVIVADRISFPFAQVAPLAPVVWQTRAPAVPCSGFGDTYNTNILGAEECSPEIMCDPNRVTSFESPVKNPKSGRKQSIFVTYETDAFSCFDRSQEETVFYDKSWDPWATHEDITTGRRMESTNLNGKEVFYKFISDTRYLQTPIKGAVYFNKSKPCDECEEWSWPDCVDPIEEGPDHPMWDEKTIQSECSARREWIRRYLEDETARQNSFLTAETSQITIAALLITPQMAGLPDITTLVKVHFSIGQNGAIEAMPELSSISETPMTTWITWCIITVVIAITFPYYSLANCVRQETLPVIAFNFAIACVVVANIGWNIYVEFSPPHVLEELTAAFAANEQDTYFDCIQAIMKFSDDLRSLKQMGFFIIVVMFLRLVLALDVHPRLGLISQVAVECADDTVHFLIQFLLMFVNLSFLAYWSFGEEDGRFRTFGKSTYMLFRFFIGDWDSYSDVPEFKFLVFWVLYVFVVFIMMVNFLLAIVVNAHTIVTDRVNESPVEQNIFLDLWDAFKHRYTIRKKKWPAPGAVIHFLQATRAEDGFSSMPAVTAWELARMPGRRSFADFRDAQAFIDYYAHKLTEGGESILLENRIELCFQEGHYFKGDGKSTGLVIESDSKANGQLKESDLATAAPLSSDHGSPGSSHMAPAISSCSPTPADLEPQGHCDLATLAGYGRLPREKQLQCRQVARVAFASTLAAAVADTENARTESKAVDTEARTPSRGPRAEPASKWSPRTPRTETESKARSEGTRSDPRRARSPRTESKARSEDSEDRDRDRSRSLGPTPRSDMRPPRSLPNPSSVHATPPAPLPLLRLPQPDSP